MSLRGSCREHYGQSPPYPVVSGGQLNSNNSSLLQQAQGSGFPMGCADSAVLDGRRGSSMYEVNQWLWHLGRGKPQLDGLNVEETETGGCPR